MKYVIGDVHGCSNTLKALLDKLNLSDTDDVYFVGDLIDRGPGSKEVVDLIMKLSSRKGKTLSCRGNHEELMMNSVKGESEYSRWLMNGGDTTLNSFGISSYVEMPEKYKSFFEHLEHYISIPEALIVHAGFDFSKQDIFSEKRHMLWTRDHTVDPEKTGGRPVIHGHTPISVEETLTMVKNKQYDLNIDTGCIYLNLPGKGYLTALRLEDMQTISVANKE